MGDTEKGNIDLLRRLQTPPFGHSPSSSTHPNYQLLANNHLDVSQLNLSQIRGPVRQNLQNLPSFGSENGRRVAGFPPSHPQMPPISPYSQMTVNRPAGQQMGLQSVGHGPCHSRSLSQPPIFNLDSLPPLGPSTYKDGVASPGSGSGSISGEHPENRDGGSNSLLSPFPPSLVGGGGSTPLMANREGLPPRKLHRRSMSDVPFGLNSGLFQSPPLPPVGRHGGGGGGGGLQKTLSGGECNGAGKPAQLVKKETCWEGKKQDGEAMDDLLAAYMNLDGNDLLNSGGANEKNDNENQEEMDSKASNLKTNGGDNSDNDAESSVNESGCSGQGGVSPGERKEGLKRSAGGDLVSTVRHQRSISMDSFMGKLQICDDSPNLQSSDAGALAGPVFGGECSKALGLEFCHGEFSTVEMKKIMANEKLAEIAVTDPKRVKRILANRQSAARSKERKMRYISELEHKVQTLQNEATTLSAQLTMLQKDSEGLTTLNNELKFRLQAMEQQAQLRDALNDALTKEIQRLRIATGELADPRTRGTEPFGFINHQMLQQQLSATQQPEPCKGQEQPSSSTNKSESSSSHE